MTAIKLENVFYAYEADEGETPVNAVDGVSLEIEEGSFGAVVGHNGSGKSTLARLLNGLLLPDKGTGTAAYNMKLSKKRAESVAKLLTEKYGISSSRIQVVGEGSNIQPFPQDNNWNRIVIFTGGE